MPRYQYTAVTLDNKKVSATVDARNDDDFRLAMRKMNLVPLKFGTIAEKGTAFKMKSADVANFCRQLANMFASGIPAARAMEILHESTAKPKQKALYGDMHKDLVKGVTMSETMRKLGKTFPELLTNMFASGEESGQFEKVTMNMAVHYEKEHRLNSQVKSAMRYPMILAVATVIVVFIVFLGVLPTFFDTLKSFGDLPRFTEIIISFTEFLQSYWIHVLISMFIIFGGGKYSLNFYSVRLAFDQFKLKAPLVAKPLKTIYTARFGRTLASLYSSGVSMIRALEITGTILNNKYIEGQFPELLKLVKSGEPLSESIAKIDGFDRKLVSTVQIGEETGRLDAMLESSAEMFEHDAEQATAAIVALMEPIMIVVLAGVILVVILAVMLPMASMYETLGV